MPDELHRIGLISDTHGLLRPQVHDVLAGVELILHAGDVVGDEILDELALIAPVKAVAGNCDFRVGRLAQSLDLEIGGVRIHVSHGHELGVPTPELLLARYDADVIVYGHTHKPLIQRSEKRLVVNPGAAGPQRFRLEPSVGLLEISGVEVEARIASLAP
jgi:putative phosphoesterase